MSNFPFEWKGQGLLIDVLKNPIKAISLMLDTHRKVETIAFWYDDTQGVRVNSTMHDVAEKLEVGVLSFGVTDHLEDGEHVVSFSDPRTPSKISKLLINESGSLLESGIELDFSSGQELVVVPSDFPCFLAIRANGIDFPSTLPNLEYMLDRYDIADMFIAQGA